MSTYFEKNIENNKKAWLLIDAKGQTLGRLASTIARLLVGKHKPIYTPHVDTGDFVVVVNADKVVMTGNKLAGKVYQDHSGYVGGVKTRTPQDILNSKRPEELLERAVWGMLRKGKLGRAQVTKLKIYVGDKHPHMAQRPQPLDLKNLM